tara:strand:+ start:134 stop:499 length:366 start_codon:yes stop_codon:yes gene_type:complete
MFGIGSNPIIYEASSSFHRSVSTRALVKSCRLWAERLCCGHPKTRKLRHSFILHRDLPCADKKLAKIQTAKNRSILQSASTPATVDRLAITIGSSAQSTKQFETSAKPLTFWSSTDLFRDF